jgi:hypothetical protein
MAKLDGTNGLIQQYDYQVLTTAFSYTFAAGTQTLIINPAGTLATGTVTMPAAPADGMVIWVTTTKQIVALTINGNTGQTLTSGVTSLAPNQAVAYLYRSSNTTWYPFETQMAQGNGPAFSAYRATSAQSFTAGVWSKVQFNAESYDTANCYDSTTNYRFTPNVAGYYSVNLSVNYSIASAASTSGLALYKNASAAKYGPVLQATINNSTTIVASYTIYLNGSTDYIEGYTFSNATTPSVNYTIEQSYFEACLIRTA